MSQTLSEQDTGADALVVRGPGEIGLEHRDPPQLEAGHVLVRPAHVGVCGTDLDIIDGRLDPAYVRLPLVLGHEWSGVVTAVADDVGSVAVGDPVVVEGIFSCGVCKACREGRTNMCLGYEELGFTLDGALQPGLSAPVRFVHRLADESLLVDGALVEPAAVVFRGLREIGVRPGDRVAVVGDGTVGLLAALLVRLWSPAQVTVFGLRETQSPLVSAVGASAFTTQSDGREREFDLVVEAAGAAAAVERAVRLADPGGRVLLFGIAGDGETVAIRVDDVVNHDLTIRGSFSYDASAWRQVVDAVNAGSIRPSVLVTHRHELGEWETAISTLRSGDGDAPRGKVLVDMVRP